MLGEDTNKSCLPQSAIFVWFFMPTPPMWWINISSLQHVVQEVCTQPDKTPTALTQSWWPLVISINSKAAGSISLLGQNILFNVHYRVVYITHSPVVTCVLRQGTGLITYILPFCYIRDIISMIQRWHIIEIQLFANIKTHYHTVFSGII